MNDKPISHEHDGHLRLGDEVRIPVRDTRLEDVAVKYRFYLLLRSALPLVKDDFCVTFASNDEPMPYVQGCRESEDLLEIELSCEAYCGRPMLAGALAYLEACGWHAPSANGIPNFWQVVNTRLNTPDEIASLLVNSLEHAYDIFSSLPEGASIEVQPLELALAAWPEDLAVDAVRMPGEDTAVGIVVPDGPLDSAAATNRGLEVEPIQEGQAMTSPNSTYPAMPAPLRLAFEPAEVLRSVDGGDFRELMEAIAGDLSGQVESLLWDRLDRLGKSWTDRYADLYLNLDNEEYPEIVEEVVDDPALFAYVFDGMPEGLREEMPALGEFIAHVQDGYDWDDSEEVRAELEAILPGLWLFDEELHAFVLTIMLLATIDFEGTLRGVVAQSFTSTADEQPVGQSGQSYGSDEVLDFDHLVLDPDVESGLEQMPRLPLHMIDAENHVHSFGPPIGHWIPGLFSLRLKAAAGESGSAEADLPPFKPVRLTDHNCIIKFVRGRWCCLGDAGDYVVELLRARSESGNAHSALRVDDVATPPAASFDDADEDSEPHCEDEFDPGFQQKQRIRESRTPQQWVDLGVQMWLPVIVALLESDSAWRVRMTPIARFDIERKLQRNEKFYELLTLQPFLFDVYNERSGESEYGFGPGENYALQRDGKWQAETMGVMMEGGPQQVAAWLLAASRSAL